MPNCRCWVEWIEPNTPKPKWTWFEIVSLLLYIDGLPQHPFFTDLDPYEYDAAYDEYKSTLRKWKAAWEREQSRR